MEKNKIIFLILSLLFCISYSLQLPASVMTSSTDTAGYTYEVSRNDPMENYSTFGKADPIAPNDGCTQELLSTSGMPLSVAGLTRRDTNHLNYTTILLLAILLTLIGSFGRYLYEERTCLHPHRQSLWMILQYIHAQDGKKSLLFS